MARPPDAGAIARVHVDSWRAAYCGLLGDERLEKLSISDRELMWREALTDSHALHSGRWLAVATADDAVVGFVGAGPARESASSDEGEIYAVYVQPVSWSAGIGQALLGAAVTHLRRIGMREALLWVLASNVRACRFYELAGLSRHGRFKTEPLLGLPDFDAEVEEVWYRRALH